MSLSQRNQYDPKLAQLEEPFASGEVERITDHDDGKKPNRWCNTARRVPAKLAQKACDRP
jgi:hypothetical protein